MSALPSIADMLSVELDVRQVPLADIVRSEGQIRRMKNSPGRMVALWEKDGDEAIFTGRRGEAHE